MAAVSHQAGHFPILVQRALLLACLGAALVLPPRAYAFNTIQFEADTIETEFGQARQVKMDYRLDGTLKLSGQLKPQGDKDWQTASLTCDKLLLGAAAAESLRCSQGRMRYPNVDLPFTLEYSRQQSGKVTQLALQLDIAQASVSDGAGLHATDKLSASLTLQASQGGAGQIAMGKTAIAQGSNQPGASRPVALAQPGIPASGYHQTAFGQAGASQTNPNQAKLNQANLDQVDASPGKFKSGQVQPQVDLSFPSRHSATPLQANKPPGSASGANAPWRWQAALDWHSGEAFWQPFYLAGSGHKLSAQGTLDAQSIEVEQASLDLHDIGQAVFSGQWRRSDKHLQNLQVDVPALRLDTAYPTLLKPLLGQGMFGDLDITGEAGLQFSLRQGEPYSARLDLRNVDLADRNGGFTLNKLNASLPWRYDSMQPLRLSYSGGSLLKLPLGAAQLQADIERYALTAATLRLPILDGALQLDDVSAAWAGGAWHGHLRANVQPIDMVLVSQALGWPRMEGKVAASIPMVTYSAGQLGVDGAMGFNLFQGSILVDQLALQQPLGLAPRLSAKLQMRNLDLGALTRTFAFGAIEGKLDGDVNDLQLLDWKPVHFDAAFYSSPGRYPKKISQRAVENISALGGAGAAAAIQRSVLRFFKEFNYQKIGLSCQLRDSLCRMNGVESTAQGYVIVKGSGVPAITVMGYNHSVNWAELLARLKRITAGNVKPVIE